MTHYAMLAVASLLVFTYFVTHFDPAVFSVVVDGSFFVAVALMVARAKVGIRFDRELVVACVVYAALMIAVAGDWRWTFAGDSLGWPIFGLHTATDGPPRSLLSVQGVAQFGAIQAHAHNLFMYLVDPTIFWHRVGKVVFGLWMIVSVYCAFRWVVPRRVAVAVSVCVAATPTIVAHTLCSYPIIDAIPASMTILATVFMVTSKPGDRSAWTWYGVSVGVASFLSANSWFMVVGTVPIVALSAWKIGAWTGPVTAFVVAGMISYPTVSQLLGGGGSEFYSLVTGGSLSLDRIAHLVTQAALIPIQWQHYSAAMFGPQIVEGFRYLYPVGIILALANRKSRIIVAIYALHIALLAVTQGPYESLSPKRALVIIPFAVYFSILPLGWALRYHAIAVAVVGLYAAIGVNEVVSNVRPGVLGYNVIDGIIEVSARFPNEQPCISFPLAPQDFDVLNAIYGISPPARMVSDLNDPTCRLACAKAGLPHGTPVKLYNSVELHCVRR